LGLADDISTLKKQDIDGFELQLISMIKKYIGSQYSSHLKICFPEYGQTQICMITVSQSGSPVFVKFEGKENFFVQAGCSSQPLTLVKQSEFEKEHWR
jgi:hypothetical protein